MKTLTTIVALSMAASCLGLNASAQASNITLKPVNDETETQACFVAATEGLDSARSFIRKSGYSYRSFQILVKCNGMNITDFANKYSLKMDKSQDPMMDSLKTVKLVARNQTSQICVDAVLLGEKEARNKYDARGEAIYCNNKPIDQFVRLFSDKTLTNVSMTQGY